MQEEKEVVPTGFREWCIVELMGHVKMAGLVTEAELFGSKLARIDIPSPDGDKFVTQYFGGSSVYRITPTTEEIARRVAANNAPSPINRWELEPVRALTAGGSDRFDRQDDEERFGDDD